MKTLTTACLAMATRFVIVLHGQNEVTLRAVAEEALGEIKRLETQLSFYQNASELTAINNRAALEPVRVEPGMFRLLLRAQQLWRETEGAFDPTIAPLMTCWGFVRGTGEMPSPAALAEARAAVGMHWVELDERRYTVRFAHPGVKLDLGSIGKGYALEQAVEILREHEIISALIHGGTSTVCALGHPPDADGWKIAIDAPIADTTLMAAPARPLAVVNLRDESLSVSAVWGKSFTAEGKIFGHVLDPRTAAPVMGSLLSAVVLPSATETDALSTALLVLGDTGLELIQQLRPAARSLVVLPGVGDASWSVHTRGIEALAPFG